MSASPPPRPVRPLGVDRRPQLLTYPDSLGGDLGALGDLLDGPLTGLFHGVHILPPFPSSGDRGFAPLSYDDIDPRFGTWAGHRTDRRAPRRAARPDDQPHLPRESRVPGLPSPWTSVRLRRPVHHARQGLAGRATGRCRCCSHLPAQARVTVLDRDDRGVRESGTSLDVFRDSRMVRADRPRRHAQRRHAP